MRKIDTNKQIEEKYKKYWMVLRIQVVIAVLAIVITIIVLFQIGTLMERKSALESVIIEKEKEINEKDDLIVKLDKKIAEKQKEITELEPIAKKGLGFKISAINSIYNIPKQSLEAQNAAKELEKSLTKEDKKRRKNITIQYFPKNLDKEVNINIVVPSLMDYGFQVMKKKAIVTWVPTNSIWFGTNVKIEDVKLVAYTLISAGVKIKYILPFQISKVRKNFLIQIGAQSIKIDGEESVQSQPVLTVEEIKKTIVFTRE